MEVVCGDVNELGTAALGGLFDLAYTRLFLMHQTDPVKTLRRIADLLRPGAGSSRRRHCAARHRDRIRTTTPLASTGSSCTN